MISADATTGQLERSIASGAERHLSKPFDVADFLTMVDQSAGVPEKATAIGAGETDEGPGRQAAGESVLAALRANGVPADKLDEIVAAFLERSNESVARLAQAIQDGDLDTVRNESHDLRGTSGSFGAGALAEIAGQLQDAAKSGSLTQAGELLDPFLRAYDQARTDLLADHPGANKRS